MRLIDHVRIEDPAESYSIVAPTFDTFFVEAETAVHLSASAQMTH